MDAIIIIIVVIIIIVIIKYSIRVGVRFDKDNIWSVLRIALSI